MIRQHVFTCAMVLILCAGLASRAETTVTVTADAAKITTIGGMQAEAWNLWSLGEWGDFFHFPDSGEYRARVRCFGSPADGVWPEMAFAVDGRPRKTVTIDHREPRDHAFTFEADERHHRLTVSFLNDALTDTGDRNLYLVEMTVEPIGDGPAPTVSTERAWRATWGQQQAEAEQMILQQAEQAIRKHRTTAATIELTGRDGQPIAGARVTAELERHAFLFGGNIFMFDRFGADRQNNLYKERFGELFNYATTGFYWRSYEPTRGEPKYADTDKVVAWCEEHDIQVKGHPLLWANEHGKPRWSNGQPAADVRQQRIRDILTRYDGRIEFWEVVNEPAHLPGLEIDAPYRWARDADADAYLIVNDYHVLADGCPPFFRLLEQAIEDGVPFDGIGIQAHEPRTMRFPLEDVWRILDEYATLGKELHITEFTPTSAGQAITGSHVRGVWDEATQADYAAKFYTVCFAHPAVVGITWWDLCDAGSWLEGGGLLRKDLFPKPAYHALHDLIRGEWTTKVDGNTDADGRFTFRGFRGRYAVTVEHDEQITRQSVMINRQRDEAIPIFLDDE